jgi:hypothetical protein
MLGRLLNESQTTRHPRVLLAGVQVLKIPGFPPKARGNDIRMVGSDICCLPDTSDSELLEMARLESRIIITADMDFPRLLALSTAPRNKVSEFARSSFRRKPESRPSKEFWTPAFAGVTVRLWFTLFCGRVLSVPENTRYSYEAR